MSSPATDSDHESPQALLEKLEKETAAKESLLGIVARLEGRLATLEMALVHHASENELLRRRLYGTKSERGGTDELQLTLGDILSEKAALQKQLFALGTSISFECGDEETTISVDGIVSVSAKDLETGREQSITVTATSGLTEDELRDLVRQSQSYMIELRASEELERRRQHAEKLIDTIRGLFPQVEDAMSGTRFGRDAMAKAEAVVQRAELDLARGDSKNLLDTMDSLDRTLGMFKNVMHKKSEAAHR